MSLKFTNLEEFENYVYNYMNEHSCKEAYVYLRYGYTEKEMLNSNFELQACSLDFLSIFGFGIGMKDKLLQKLLQLLLKMRLQNLQKQRRKNENDNSG